MEHFTLGRVLTPTALAASSVRSRRLWRRAARTIKRGQYKHYMLRFTTGHLLRQDEEDKKEEAKQTLWRRAKIKTRMMMNLSGSNSKVTFGNSDNLGSHV